MGTGIENTRSNIFRPAASAFALHAASAQPEVYIKQEKEEALCQTSPKLDPAVKSDTG